MFYRVIKKGEKFNGFCDWYGKFFSELSPEELEERTSNCEHYKEFTGFALFQDDVTG
jgi:hypothetical protein